MSAHEYLINESDKKRRVEVDIEDSINREVKRRIKILKEIKEL